MFASWSPRNHVLIESRGPIKQIGRLGPIYLELSKWTDAMRYLTAANLSVDYKLNCNMWLVNVSVKYWDSYDKSME
jgi:hypothetical protein